MSAVPYDKAVALAYSRHPGAVPYIGSERKNSVRKAGEHYKHREEKSGSVALRPVEIPPEYLCSNTSSWPMSIGESCTVPGRHNSVGQVSPGRIQLLLLSMDEL